STLYALNLSLEQGKVDTGNGFACSNLNRRRRERIRASRIETGNISLGVSDIGDGPGALHGEEIAVRAQSRNTKFTEIVRRRPIDFQQPARASKAGLAEENYIGIGNRFAFFIDHLAANCRLWSQLDKQLGERLNLGDGHYVVVAKESCAF